MSAPTTNDLLAALDECGLPFAMGGWAEGGAPALPYVAMMPGESRQAHADNRTWATSTTWDVELYTDLRRDTATEHRLEAALDAHGLAWSKGFQALPSQRMHETYYRVPVIGD